MYQLPSLRKLLLTLSYVVFFLTLFYFPFNTHPPISTAQAQDSGYCENGWTFNGGDAGDDNNWEYTGCGGGDEDDDGDRDRWWEEGDEEEDDDNTNYCDEDSWTDEETSGEFWCEDGQACYAQWRRDESCNISQDGKSCRDDSRCQQEQNNENGDDSCPYVRQYPECQADGQVYEVWQNCRGDWDPRPTGQSCDAGSSGGDEEENQGGCPGNQYWDTETGSCVVNDLTQTQENDAIYCREQCGGSCAGDLGAKYCTNPEGGRVYDCTNPLDQWVAECQVEVGEEFQHVGIDPDPAGAGDLAAGQAQCGYADLDGGECRGSQFCKTHILYCDGEVTGEPEVGGNCNLVPGLCGVGSDDQGNLIVERPACNPECGSNERCMDDGNGAGFCQAVENIPANPADPCASDPNSAACQADQGEQAQVESFQNGCEKRAGEYYTECNWKTHSVQAVCSYSGQYDTRDLGQQGGVCNAPAEVGNKAYCANVNCGSGFHCEVSSSNVAECKPDYGDDGQPLASENTSKPLEQAPVEIPARCRDIINPDRLDECIQRESGQTPGGGQTDASCQAQTPDENYCDGNVCIQKSSGWDGNTCVPVYKSVPNSYCNNACSGDSAQSGETVKLVNCLDSRDDTSREECKAENTRIIQSGREVEAASRIKASLSLENCSSLEGEAKEACENKNQETQFLGRVLDSVQLENCAGKNDEEKSACDARNAQAIRQGQARLNLGVEDCSRLTGDQKTNCEFTNYQRDQIAQAAAAFVPEDCAKYQNEAEVLACNQNNQTRYSQAVNNFSPFVGLAEVGASCVYTEACPEGGNKACAGKVASDNGAPVCKYDPAAASCSACTTAPINLRNTENKCSDDGQTCLNAPGYICRVDADCQGRLQAAQQAAANAPIDPSKYFSQQFEEGVACKQVQACEDGQEQVCEGKGAGGACDLSQGGGICTPCQAKGTITLNKVATCNPQTNKCEGAPALSGCSNDEQCKPVVTNTVSNVTSRAPLSGGQVVGSNGNIFDSRTVCQTEVVEIRDFVGNLEKDYGLAGDIDGASYGYNIRRENVEKCYQQYVDTGRAATVTTQVVTQNTEYYYAQRDAANATNRLDQFQASVSRNAEMGPSDSIDTVLQYQADQQKALDRLKQAEAAMGIVPQASLALDRSTADAQVAAYTKLNQIRATEIEIGRDLAETTAARNEFNQVSIGNTADSEAVAQRYDEFEKARAETQAKIDQLALLRGESGRGSSQQYQNQLDLLPTKADEQFNDDLDTRQVRQLGNLAKGSENIEVIRAAEEGIKLNTDEVAARGKTQLADALAFQGAQDAVTGYGRIASQAILAPQPSPEVVNASGLEVARITASYSDEPERATALVTDYNSSLAFAEAQRAASAVRAQAQSEALGTTPPQIYETITTSEGSSEVRAVPIDIQSEQAKLDAAKAEVCAVSESRCRALEAGIGQGDAASFAEKVKQDAIQKTKLLAEHSELQQQIFALERSGGTQNSDELTRIVGLANAKAKELDAIDPNVGALARNMFTDAADKGRTQNQEDYAANTYANNKSLLVAFENAKRSELGTLPNGLDTNTEIKAAEERMMRSIAQMEAVDAPKAAQMQADFNLTTFKIDSLPDGGNLGSTNGCIVESCNGNGSSAQNICNGQTSQPKSFNAFCAAQNGVVDPGEAWALSAQANREAALAAQAASVAQTDANAAGIMDAITQNPLAATVAVLNPLALPILASNYLGYNLATSADSREQALAGVQTAWDVVGNIGTFVSDWNARSAESVIPVFVGDATQQDTCRQIYQNPNNVIRELNSKSAGCQVDTRSFDQQIADSSQIISNGGTVKDLYYALEGQKSLAEIRQKTIDRAAEEAGVDVNLPMAYWTETQKAKFQAKLGGLDAGAGTDVVSAVLYPVTADAEARAAAARCETDFGRDLCRLDPFTAASYQGVATGDPAKYQQTLENAKKLIPGLTDVPQADFAWVVSSISDNQSGNLLGDITAPSTQTIRRDQYSSDEEYYDAIALNISSSSKLNRDQLIDKLLLDANINGLTPDGQPRSREEIAKAVDAYLGVGYYGNQVVANSSSYQWQREAENQYNWEVAQVAAGLVTVAGPLEFLDPTNPIVNGVIKGTVKAVSGPTRAVVSVTDNIWDNVVRIPAANRAISEGLGVTDNVGQQAIRSYFDGRAAGMTVDQAISAIPTSQRSAFSDATTGIAARLGIENSGDKVVAATVLDNVWRPQVAAAEDIVARGNNLINLVEEARLAGNLDRATFDRMATTPIAELGGRPLITAGEVDDLDISGIFTRELNPLEQQMAAREAAENALREAGDLPSISGSAVDQRLADLKAKVEEKAVPTDQEVVRPRISNGAEIGSRYGQATDAESEVIDRILSPSGNTRNVWNGLSEAEKDQVLRQAARELEVDTQARVVLSQTPANGRQAYIQLANQAERVRNQETVGQLARAVDNARSVTPLVIQAVDNIVKQADLTPSQQAAIELSNINENALRQSLENLTPAQQQTVAVTLQRQGIYVTTEELENRLVGEGLSVDQAKTVATALQPASPTPATTAPSIAASQPGFRQQVADLFNSVFRRNTNQPSSAGQTTTATTQTGATTNTTTTPGGDSAPTGTTGTVTAPPLTPANPTIPNAPGVVNRALFRVADWLKVAERPLNWLSGAPGTTRLITTPPMDPAAAAQLSARLTSDLPSLERVAVTAAQQYQEKLLEKTLVEAEIKALNARRSYWVNRTFFKGGSDLEIHLGIKKGLLDEINRDLPALQTSLQAANRDLERARIDLNAANKVIRPSTVAEQQNLRSTSVRQLTQRQKDLELARKQLEYVNATEPQTTADRLRLAQDELAKLQAQLARDGDDITNFTPDKQQIWLQAHQKVKQLESDASTEKAVLDQAREDLRQARNGLVFKNISEEQYADALTKRNAARLEYDQAVTKVNDILQDTNRLTLEVQLYTDEIATISQIGNQINNANRRLVTTLAPTEGFSQSGGFGFWWQQSEADVAFFMDSTGRLGIDDTGKQGTWVIATYKKADDGTVTLDRIAVPHTTPQNLRDIAKAATPGKWIPGKLSGDLEVISDAEFTTSLASAQKVDTQQVPIVINPPGAAQTTPVGAIPYGDAGINRIEAVVQTIPSKDIQVGNYSTFEGGNRQINPGSGGASRSTFWVSNDNTTFTKLFIDSTSEQEIKNEVAILQIASIAGVAPKKITILRQNDRIVGYSMENLEATGMQKLKDRIDSLDLDQRIAVANALAQYQESVGRIHGDLDVNWLEHIYIGPNNRVVFIDPLDIGLTPPTTITSKREAERLMERLFGDNTTNLSPVGNIVELQESKALGTQILDSLNDGKSLKQSLDEIELNQSRSTSSSSNTTPAAPSTPVQPAAPASTRITFDDLLEAPDTLTAAQTRYYDDLQFEKYFEDAHQVLFHSTDPAEIARIKSELGLSQNYSETDFFRQLEGLRNDRLRRAEGLSADEEREVRAVLKDYLPQEVQRVSTAPPATTANPPVVNNFEALDTSIREINGYARIYSNGFFSPPDPIPDSRLEEILLRNGFTGSQAELDQAVRELSDIVNIPAPAAQSAPTPIQRVVQQTPQGELTDTPMSTITIPEGRQALAGAFDRYSSDLPNTVLDLEQVLGPEVGRGRNGVYYQVMGDQANSSTIHRKMYLKFKDQAEFAKFIEEFKQTDPYGTVISLKQYEGGEVVLYIAYKPNVTAKSELDAVVGNVESIVRSQGGNNVEITGFGLFSEDPKGILITQNGEGVVVASGFSLTPQGMASNDSLRERLLIPELVAVARKYETLPLNPGERNAAILRLYDTNPTAAAELKEVYENIMRMTGRDPLAPNTNRVITIAVDPTNPVTSERAVVFAGQVKQQGYDVRVIDTTNNLTPEGSVIRTTITQDGFSVYDQPAWNALEQKLADALTPSPATPLETVAQPVVDVLEDAASGVRGFSPILKPVADAIDDAAVVIDGAIRVTDGLNITDRNSDLLRQQLDIHPAVQVLEGDDTALLHFVVESDLTIRPAREGEAFGPGHFIVAVEKDEAGIAQINRLYIDFNSSTRLATEAVYAVQANNPLVSGPQRVMYRTEKQITGVVRQAVPGVNAGEKPVVQAITDEVEDLIVAVAPFDRNAALADAYTQADRLSRESAAVRQQYDELVKQLTETHPNYPPKNSWDEWSIQWMIEKNPQLVALNAERGRLAEAELRQIARIRIINEFGFETDELIEAEVVITNFGGDPDQRVKAGKIFSAAREHGRNYRDYLDPEDYLVPDEPFSENSIPGVAQAADVVDLVRESSEEVSDVVSSLSDVIDLRPMAERNRDAIIARLTNDPVIRDQGHLLGTDQVNGVSFVIEEDGQIRRAKRADSYTPGYFIVLVQKDTSGQIRIVDVVVQADTGSTLIDDINRAVLDTDPAFNGQISPMSYEKARDYGFAVVEPREAVPLADSAVVQLAEEVADVIPGAAPIVDAIQLAQDAVPVASDLAEVVDDAVRLLSDSADVLAPQRQVVQTQGTSINLTTGAVNNNGVVANVGGGYGGVISASTADINTQVTANIDQILASAPADNLPDLRSHLYQGLTSLGQDTSVVGKNVRVTLAKQIETATGPEAVVAYVGNPKIYLVSETGAVRRLVNSWDVSFAQSTFNQSIQTAGTAAILEEMSPRYSLTAEAIKAQLQTGFSGNGNRAKIQTLIGQLEDILDTASDPDLALNELIERAYRNDLQSEAFLRIMFVRRNNPGFALGETSPTIISTKLNPGEKIVILSSGAREVLTNSEISRVISDPRAADQLTATTFQLNSSASWTRKTSNPVVSVAIVEAPKANTSAAQVLADASEIIPGAAPVVNTIADMVDDAVDLLPPGPVRQSVEDAVDIVQGVSVAIRESNPYLDDIDWGYNVQIREQDALIRSDERLLSTLTQRRDQLLADKAQVESRKWSISDALGSKKAADLAKVNTELETVGNQIITTEKRLEESNDQRAKILNTMYASQDQAKEGFVARAQNPYEVINSTSLPKIYGLSEEQKAAVLVPGIGWQPSSSPMGQFTISSNPDGRERTLIYLSTDGQIIYKLDKSGKLTATEIAIMINAQGAGGMPIVKELIIEPNGTVFGVGMSYKKGAGIGSAEIVKNSAREIEITPEARLGFLYGMADFYQRTGTFHGDSFKYHDIPDGSTPAFVHDANILLDDYQPGRGYGKIEWFDPISDVGAGTDIKSEFLGAVDYFLIGRGQLLSGGVQSPVAKTPEMIELGEFIKAWVDNGSTPQQALQRAEANPKFAELMQRGRTVRDNTQQANLPGPNCTLASNISPNYLAQAPQNSNVLGVSTGEVLAVSTGPCGPFSQLASRLPSILQRPVAKVASDLDGVITRIQDWRDPDAAYFRNLEEELIDDGAVVPRSQSVLGNPVADEAYTTIKTISPTTNTPEYTASLAVRRQLEEALKTESRNGTDVWKVGSGQYGASARLNTSQLTNIEQTLESEIQTRLLNSEQKPVVLVDFGGGYGTSMVRVASKFRSEVENGDLVIVVTNFGLNEGQIQTGFTSKYTGMAKIMEAADSLSTDPFGWTGEDLDFMNQNQGLVNFINSSAEELPSQVIQTPKGSLALNGQIDLLHEQFALTHSQTPELALTIIGDNMSDTGRMFLQSKAAHSRIGTVTLPGNKVVNLQDSAIVEARRQGFAIGDQVLTEKFAMQKVSEGGYQVYSKSEAVDTIAPISNNDIPTQRPREIILTGMEFTSPRVDSIGDFRSNGLIVSKTIETVPFAIDTKDFSIPAGATIAKADFLPFGSREFIPGTSTVALAKGVVGTTDYINYIDSGTQRVPDFLVGTTNAQMVGATERLGFKVIEIEGDKITIAADLATLRTNVREIEPLIPRLKERAEREIEIYKQKLASTETTPVGCQIPTSNQLANSARNVPSNVLGVSTGEVLAASTGPNARVCNAVDAIKESWVIRDLDSISGGRASEAVDAIGERVSNLLPDQSTQINLPEEPGNYLYYFENGVLSPTKANADTPPILISLVRSDGGVRLSEVVLPQSIQGDPAIVAALARASGREINPSQLLENTDDVLRNLEISIREAPVEQPTTSLVSIPVVSQLDQISGGMVSQAVRMLEDLMKPGDIKIDSLSLVQRTDGSVAGLSKSSIPEILVGESPVRLDGSLREEVVQRLQLSPDFTVDSSGKYKVAFVDPATDSVVVFFRPYSNFADTDRATRNAVQLDFYLKHQDQLEGVSPITAIIRNAEGDVVGVKYAYSGQTLTDFLRNGSKLDPRAIDRLALQQARNIQTTGFAHGDLFFLYPSRDDGQIYLKLDNILVSYDQNGQQVLTMIDYNGVGGKVSQTSIEITNSEWMSREPELLKKGLSQYQGVVDTSPNALRAMQQEIDSRGYNIPISVVDIPRPIRAVSIDPIKAQQWVSAHNDPIDRAVAEKILANTRVVHQSEFEEAVAQAAQDFGKTLKPGEEYILLTWPGKSNLWVSELALPHIGKLPEAVVSLYGITDAPLENFKARRYLFIDDALFSGGQMSGAISGLAAQLYGKNLANLFDGSELNPGVGIDIVTPYMTKQSQSNITTRGINSSNTNFYTTEILPSVTEVLSDPELISAARRMYGNIDHRTLLLFDHKIPDIASTLTSVYDGGKVYGQDPFTGRSVNVMNMPFVSKVATPYAGYNKYESASRFFMAVEEDMYNNSTDEFLAKNIPSIGTRIKTSIYTLRTEKGDFIALRNPASKILVLNSLGEQKAQLEATSLRESLLISKLDQGDQIKVVVGDGRQYSLKYSNGRLTPISGRDDVVTDQGAICPMALKDDQQSRYLASLNSNILGISTGEVLAAATGPCGPIASRVSNLTAGTPLHNPLVATADQIDTVLADLSGNNISSSQLVSLQEQIDAKNYAFPLDVVDVPRPQTRSEIDLARAEQWIDPYLKKFDNLPINPAQKRAVVETILSNTRIVHQDEFEVALAQATRQFSDTLQPGEKYTVISMKGKSNHWAAQLAVPQVKQLPENVYQIGQIDQIARAERVDRYVLFDDSLYSGTQMYTLIRNIARNLNLKDGNSEIDIVIPYVSNFGKDSIAKAAALEGLDPSKIRIFSVTELPSASQVLQEKGLLEPASQMYRDLDQKVLVAFDHKFPDEISTVSEILNRNNDFIVADSEPYRPSFSSTCQLSMRADVIKLAGTGANVLGVSSGEVLAASTGRCGPLTTMFLEFAKAPPNQVLDMLTMGQVFDAYTDLFVRLDALLPTSVAEPAQNIIERLLGILNRLENPSLGGDAIIDDLGKETADLTVTAKNIADAQNEVSLSEVFGERLAKGGFGVIYSDGEVATKIFLPETLADEELYQAHLREIEVLKNSSDIGLPAFYGTVKDESGRVVGYRQELIMGDGIEDYLSSGGRLSITEAESFMTDLLKLQERLGYHGDFSGQNVIIQTIQGADGPIKKVRFIDVNPNPNLDDAQAKREIQDMMYYLVAPERVGGQQIRMIDASDEEIIRFSGSVLDKIYPKDEVDTMLIRSYNLNPQLVSQLRG